MPNSFASPATLPQLSIRCTASSLNSELYRLAVSLIGPPILTAECPQFIPSCRVSLLGCSTVSVNPYTRSTPAPPIPPLRRTPVTRDRKIYLASYQCVPAEPPPRRLSGRVLLTAGRASAGQHLSPTRRRRKASSNSLPAFRAEQSVRPPGWDPAGLPISPRAILSGATGVCRPRRSREQIRHLPPHRKAG